MDVYFDSDIAKKYGVPEAVVIRFLQECIACSIAENRYYYDGKYWTFCTLDSFVEILPFFSKKQMRTIIDHLVSENVIMKGYYSDNTTWYTFTTQSALCPNGHEVVSKKAQSCAQMGNYARARIDNNIFHDNNNYINNILSSTTNSACACARIEANENFQLAYRWIYDNEDTNEILCYRHGIDRMEYDVYVREFITEKLISGVDVKNQGRVEIKRHFANWLPKYIKAKRNEQLKELTAKEKENGRKQSDSATENCSGSAIDKVFAFLRSNTQ